MTTRAVRTVATLAAVVTVAACGSGEDNDAGASSDGPIVVWTTDTLPDRVAATEAIIDDFTDATGIEVELVGVAEDQFNQLLTSAAAAGDLPDVIGSISLAAVRTLAANELAGTDINAAVIESLGAATFNERALEMTRDGDQQLAVPSESWAQLLYYRTDLFEDAGLDAPQTYEDVLAAAQALDEQGLAGFVGATTPGAAFTQQTFEHIALGNGCQMVDEAGTVLFDSPQCVQALEFYGDLVQNHSVAGGQDVDTVRASYFAGQAAMFIWSTFVLDEMAGLRDDAMPSCDECEDDPAYLAANTGIVPAIQGPDGTAPAQFGEITSWTATVDASPEPARQFIEYVLSDGYLDWVGIAPEGKFPVREGTADNPTEYVDAWQTLPVGVDTKAPLDEHYPPEVLEALRDGLSDLNRWGITQGQGDLVGASLGELPVAQAVSDVTSGSAEPEAAAKQAADALREIQDSLR
ncbi:extracellular solute-binding protein [Phytoactinopolyspora alkaliphila]|uniref:Extracellular solute-binding protein n=1 Tax=Phytoactinopolyspora alkaliphila TaxID=1783498 RepID=A0A6N9YID8_9ACTN|nr:extracellular solute-binding protein [Phytoactinopolyspora alkaliphila]NED94680.1 extracellular solute-binding protein [Phytoactinopolyspora alkaliphila]